MYAAHITEILKCYEDRIAFVKGKISEILSKVSKFVYRRIYVDGGKRMQSCLQAGVLKKMIITFIPIFLGCGVLLFCHFEKNIYLEHKEIEVLGFGLVKSHYMIDKEHLPQRGRV